MCRPCRLRTSLKSPTRDEYQIIAFASRKNVEALRELLAPPIKSGGSSMFQRFARRALLVAN
jgi:hypothetical protein